MHKYDSVYNLPKDGYYNSQHFSKRPIVSWSAVTAGVVTSFMVAIVLTMLLMGLGLSSFDMQAENPGSAAGLSIGIGSIVIMVISLFAGSYMSGKLSGKSGAIHGFLNWASLSLFAFILSAMAISSAVKLSSSLVGSALNVGAVGIAQNQDSLSDAYNNVKNKSAASNVNTTLKNYGLNSDFLDKYKDEIQAKLDGKTYANDIIDNYKKDLSDARTVISQAAQNFKNNPDNAQTIANQMKTDLDNIAGRLATTVETTDINNKLLADNVDSSKATSMSQDVINELNIARVETRNKIMDAKTTITKTQDSLNNLPQAAGDMLENTTNKVGHGAWWAFLSSVIGAGISAFAGKLGAKSRHSHHTHNHEFELQPSRNYNDFRNCDVRTSNNTDFVSDVKVRNTEWNDKHDL